VDCVDSDSPVGVEANTSEKSVIRVDINTEHDNSDRLFVYPFWGADSVQLAAKELSLCDFNPSLLLSNLLPSSIVKINL